MNKRVYNALMRKRASAMSDWAKPTATGIVANAAGGLGFAANRVGDLAGGFVGEDNKQEAMKELLGMESTKQQDAAWVPGYGRYKLSRRRALLNQILQDKNNTEHSTVSRGIYDLVSSLNPLNGLAYIPAHIAAGLTDKKSIKELKDIANDENYGLKSMLIPGWNTYTRLKVQGGSDRLSSMIDQLSDEDMQQLDPEVQEVIRKHKKNKAKED